MSLPKNQYFPSVLWPAFTYKSSTIWHMPPPIKSLAVFLPAVALNHCISRVNLDSDKARMWWKYFSGAGVSKIYFEQLNLCNSLSVISCAMLPFVNVTWNWLKSHWALRRKAIFYSFMFVSVLNIELQCEVIYGNWVCLISKPSLQMP